MKTLTICSLGSKPTWWGGGIPKRSLSIWDMAAGLAYMGNCEGCKPLEQRNKILFKKSSSSFLL